MDPFPPFSVQRQNGVVNNICDSMVGWICSMFDKIRQCGYTVSEQLVNIIIANV